MNPHPRRPGGSSPGDSSSAGAASGDSASGDSVSAGSTSGDSSSAGSAPAGSAPAETTRTVTLHGDGLTLEDLLLVARAKRPLELGADALERVRRSRGCVEERLDSGEHYYGINTGFGFLSDVPIGADKLAQLQLNLIRSHACGVGEPLAEDVVRAVLTLRIQTMLRGHSGVRPETIALMAECLNRQITPVIPSQGSVGASGDLAPLAHLALALIGEGEVFFGGARRPAEEVLAENGLAPLQPAPKEGLCLINGTQVMTAIGLLAWADAQLLAKTADVAAAMTLDATRGTVTAMREQIQAVRPHAGQAVSASNVRMLLTDDGIARSHQNCPRVQDAYSIRCTPQVHGAIRGAFDHVLSVLVTEANSSTDNPLVFCETNEILSGGNFHGEPVALALDYFAIALAELAGISERRIEKLINPHTSELPAFLTRDGGLNSGYMIPHVVAAALVNENKVLAHPASVDSIPTSAGKEDHVSMGMTSALKLQRILRNVSHVLAIELLAAAEGLDLLAPLEGGVGVRAAHALIRQRHEAMITDRSLSADIETLASALLSGAFLDALEPQLPERLH